MFRGTQNGNVDDKGRLKLSASVKRRLKQTYSQPEVFVTSLDGKTTKVFPIREWEAVEQRLFGKGSGSEPLPDASARNRILFHANRFGSEERVDAQGRLRVPSPLRETAGMKGPVKIQWQSNHLLVMSEDQFNEAVEANTLSQADFDFAARLGL